MSKIKFIPYQLVPASFNPWRVIYLDVAHAVIAELAHPDFQFLHFGSSSFEVAGKGIIDISILYKPGQLTEAVEHLKSIGFRDQHSNKPFPENRPRKDIAVIFKNETFQVHAHVIELGSEEHLKQVNFKTHMLNNPDARAQYEATKQRVIADGLTVQDDYGKAKSPFVKSVLQEMAKP
ncbi:hypothetical protein C1E24_17530 [Pseudoalteromonas phenolica]|uniref:GrpB family protein n=1 Tax=Pseudoalteromonas phenolica TaxID=161398 RepID=A0A5R9PYP1_9GAMM|nr:GrpB family protein [Pseudoalteromonas phenolica]TLX45714.1 hypothetical protein C1E24_17530 [Pseudoalteromonas phenolica]